MRGGDYRNVSYTVIHKMTMLDLAYLGEHGILADAPNQMEGLEFMSHFPNNAFSAAFFDPQYQGIMEHLKFGTSCKQKARRELPQMPTPTIQAFIAAIASKLRPEGHLFLWLDKFHMGQGFQHWITGGLLVVDFITWDKERMGQGFRTRYQTEFCVIVQKEPKTTKGLWQDRKMRDIYREKKPSLHTHSKPVGLYSALLEQTTAEGDWVLDPASGGYTTLSACQRTNRRFMGCDLNPAPECTGELL